MAPTKRARPAFSPPRPRKQKPTTTSAAKSTTSISKSRKTDTPKPSKSKSKAKAFPTSEARRRSRLVSPTPSASDSQDSNTQDEDEDEAAASASNSEEEPPTTTTSSPNQDPDPTSEPDYILAEITHSPSITSTTTSNPIIPTPLLHRILQSHFSHPQETKISTDAREMAGRYIDVFVREAVMRCAYEKSGKEGAGTGAGTGGDGWLEVEDLERVAVQLCLDF